MNEGLDHLPLEAQDRILEYRRKVSELSIAWAEQVARVAELEAVLPSALRAKLESAESRIAELESHLHAWRFRFPNLEYVSKIDGIQPKR